MRPAGCDCRTSSEVGGRARRSHPPAGLAWALGLLVAGEAAALVVPTFDHLSRAFGEETHPLVWFRERRLSLIATDVCSDRFADAAAPPAPAPASASGVRAVAQAGIGTLGVDPRSWALAAAGSSHVPARRPA